MPRNGGRLLRMLMFVSLLATLLFGSTLVLLVNYAVVTWEKTKIDSLASKIKQTDNLTILSKGVASHRFTSLDVSDNMKPATARKSLTRTAAGLYNKTITVIATQNYAGWWGKIVEELAALRRDWLGTLRRWFVFFMSLAKPLTDDQGQTAQAIEKEERQKRELSAVVDRVKDASRNPAESFQSTPTNDPTTTSQAVMVDAASTADHLVAANQNPPLAAQRQDRPQVATIGLGAGFDTGKTDTDMTQFEKIERRILDRLQASGLKNYDIWIQLGDFYLKYGELEKAKEIFALVLKQANGEQKEIARNRLISF